MNPYRTSPHAHAAPPAPMWPLWPVVLWLAFSWLAGCTPAAQQTAATVIGDVASAAPLVCTVVTVADPSSGSVCGTATGDISAVAKLIASILASLPKAAQAPTAGTASFVYHRVVVTLPAAQAAAVAKALP